MGIRAQAKQRALEEFTERLTKLELQVRADLRSLNLEIVCSQVFIKHHCRQRRCSRRRPVRAQRPCHQALWQLSRLDLRLKLNCLDSPML